LKKGIETLYTLQQNDDKIRDIESLIKEIPQTIKKIETQRDGKETIVENSKKKLNENTKGREKLEKEILLVKEKIKKYKDQMSKATTNKEYQGFMNEIKYEEDNITSIEEKIIERMLESDEIIEEIRKSEDEYKDIAESFNKDIKDYKQQLDYNKSKLSEAAEEVSKLREAVPEKLLKVYDQLKTKKGGKAVSLVETDFCGVCNVKIRPQRLNELISTNDMFFCENCRRILYYKIEVQPESTAE